MRPLLEFLADREERGIHEVYAAMAARLRSVSETFESELPAANNHFCTIVSAGRRRNWLEQVSLNAPDGPSFG
jgi:hypothetical protein